MSKTSKISRNKLKVAQNCYLLYILNYKYNNMQKIMPRVEVVSFLTDNYYQASKNKRGKDSERVKNTCMRMSDIINQNDMKKVSKQALFGSYNGYSHSLEYSFRNIPQTRAGNYQRSNKLSTLV